MPSDDVRLSKFLALVLRHEPQRIGLTLDPNGWANVDDLLRLAAAHGVLLSEPDLRRVVANNSKQRYVLDDTHRRIRANQGHSITVDLGLESIVPPADLYHGTTRRNVESILRTGLQPMQRQHVHLSSDRDTAHAVGSRHGDPTIFVVAAGMMHHDGYRFYRSANGVWLTASVPARYLPSTP